MCDVVEATNREVEDAGWDGDEPHSSPGKRIITYGTSRRMNAFRDYSEETSQPATRGEMEMSWEMAYDGGEEVAEVHRKNHHGLWMKIRICVIRRRSREVNHCRETQRYRIGIPNEIENNCSVPGPCSADRLQQWSFCLPLLLLIEWTDGWLWFL